MCSYSVPQAGPGMYLSGSVFTILMLNPVRETLRSRTLVSTTTVMLPRCGPQFSAKVHPPPGRAPDLPGNNNYEVLTLLLDGIQLYVINIGVFQIANPGIIDG